MTSNKEMNSYVGMTMVKKNKEKMTISINEAYFSNYQPVHISPLIISSNYVGWECEKYALLIAFCPCSFKPLSFLHSCSFP